MNTTWLLDANVIGYLFQEGGEAVLETAGTVGFPLAVVHQVRTELGRTNPDKHPWARRYLRWTWPSSVTVLDPVFGDEADQCYRRLQRRYSTQPPSASQRGLGELCSIAYAMIDPTLVFVAGLAHNYVTRLPSAGRSALRSPSG